MKPTEAKRKLAELQASVEKIIRGKTDVVRMAIVGLLAEGHLLFEDVPGVGKTTLAQCLAHSLGLSFQRIQFTSDMLPSDILGVTVYDARTREFEFRKGPIFANIVLVDEINRTTPKTQSALLEAMNTAHVTIEKTTYDLPRPFIVMATQNPSEIHGTFPLPHNQLDRFLMRLHLGYPDAENERRILQDLRRASDFSAISPALTSAEAIEMQSDVLQVKIEESLVDYIVRFAQATRNSRLFEVGVSTRGALALRRCAQARAYSEGRDYVTPDDVKEMAVPALAHRVQTAKALENGAGPIGQGASQIESLLEELAVPI
jgi:MoxR-like ATPase